MTPAPLIAPDQKDRLIRQLEVYRDRLLDVSWRNRSILLRKTQKKWTIDLATLSDGVSDEVVLDNVHRRTSTCLVRDSLRTEEADEHRSHLTQLSRQANLTEEETGLKESYVGFPFLAGRITPEHYIRAPLVLFPVHVSHSKDHRPQGWHAEILTDEDPTVNRSLLAALRKVVGIQLPRDFEERVKQLMDELRDDQALTPASLYDAVSNLLRKHDFPLADNPWDGSSQSLPTLTKEQESQIGDQPLHLEPYVVLGSFPQASEAIYEDYETLIERAQQGETDQGIIDNLLEAPADTTTRIGEGDASSTIDIDAVPDREINNVLDSDASQDQAILLSRGTECTVIRGPPGTGKSQTIVNLISNSLSKGERLLVVCQKRAALDVVYQRLHDEGLGNCVLLVHDAKADRASTYHQMSAALGSQVSGGWEPGRNATNLSAQIDERIKALNRLITPLWQPFHGTRLAHLYALAEPGAQPRLQVSPDVLQADWLDVQDALNLLAGLEDSSHRYDTTTHAWAQRTSFAALGTFGRNEIRASLDAAIAACEKDYEPLPLERSAATIAADLEYYEARRKKLFHSWSPRWRRSQRATLKFFQTRGKVAIPDDAATWATKLRARDGLDQALQSMGRYLRPDGMKHLTQATATREVLNARLRALREGLSDYEQIRDYDLRCGQLTGVSRVLFDVARQQLASEKSWADTLRQEIILQWIQEAEKKWPDLGADVYERHKTLRDELHRLLSDKRKRLIKELNDRALSTARTPVLPPGEHHGNRRADTDWHKVRYELDKQRRIWPIRKLVDTFPHVVRRVTPCWLVSPETVSEVFPLDRAMFDVVIFDEASQLAVERALPAIYRGKRIIIAGDEKQLRPFDLFRTKGDDGDEEGLEDPALQAESLLMLAKRIYGFRYLSYHYRSRHAELIDYSNHAFYEGNLEVIASLRRSQGQRPPTQPAIQWHSVNGTWSSRTNVQEAVYVVDLISKTLRGPEINGEPPSIGIITFNDQQRNLILDEIDERAGRDRDFALLWNQSNNPPDGNLDKKPFVKNIENVQGDERDIIIFSVAYGRDPQGVFRHQFGSLNVDGGENRLNVAVTRARYGVHVVCSFDPRDLRVDTTQNPGPKRLRDYLLYAEAVSAANRTQIEDVLKSLNEGFKRRKESRARFDSPLEESVYEALVDRGFEVDTQVGYSGYAIDLAIVHPSDPEHYILAVECDGATYHSAKSVRERDVGRQRFLERMGWRVERIWSRNWWTTRDREVQRIVRRIGELTSKPPPTIQRELHPRPRGPAGSEPVASKPVAEGTATRSGDDLG